MTVLKKNRIDEIQQVCSSHHVDKLYLFGSATREDFNEDSDYDFLVRFAPFEPSQYFANYLDFKDSLENLLKRKVDVLEEQTLKNPVLIKSIERSKKLIYG